MLALHKAAVHHRQLRVITCPIEGKTPKGTPCTLRPIGGPVTRFHRRLPVMSMGDFPQLVGQKRLNVHRHANRVFGSIAARSGAPSYPGQGVPPDCASVGRLEAARCRTRSLLNFLACRPITQRITLFRGFESSQFGRSSVRNIGTDLIAESLPLGAGEQFERDANNQHYTKCNSTLQSS